MNARMQSSQNPHLKCEMWGTRYLRLPCLKRETWDARVDPGTTGAPFLDPETWDRTSKEAQG